MLVVDASCLVEVLVGGERAEPVRQRLVADQDHVAPHVIDVEVPSVVRRHLLLGAIDPTTAAQAVEDLADWPAERFDHRDLLARAWELRANVRSWDAVYVALAEALGAVLVTTDARLGKVQGIDCVVEVVAGPERAG